MMGNQAGPIFVGVDVGASRTKVTVLDPEKVLLGHAVMKSGTDFAHTSQVCLDSVLEMARASRQAIERCVSTGYGRKNVPFSQETKTEIGCHAKGCFQYYPFAMTGGVVAHNPYLVKMVKEIVKHEILVPEYPQLTGAVGAALLAIEDGK